MPYGRTAVPLHDLGYRTWQGRLSPQWWRWWVIAQTGMRLAWRSRWLRRLLLVAWLPMMYVAIGFFVYEQLAAAPQTANVRDLAFMFIDEFPDAKELIKGLDQADPARARHWMWAWLLSTFFRYPQGVLMVLVVGLIAPPLIAQDVRSRAFLLYFSRPLARREYILGKGAVVTGYLLMITTLPALVLYVLGLLLSPGLSVVLHTWDLPLRILGASVVLIVPTTAMSLAFSSLTSESRYASFAWFAVWVLGWVAYVLLIASLPGSFMRERWTLISLYHTLGRVQNWVFGFETDAAGLMSAGALLAGITVVSLLILFRRVSSPMRI